MSDTEIVGQEQRDEAIADAIVSGRSLRSVRKEFGLSQVEVDAALERLWPIDTQSRLRMIMADVGQITRLTQVFFEKGLAGDTQSWLVRRPTVGAKARAAGDECRCEVRGRYSTTERADAARADQSSDLGGGARPQR